MEGGSDTELGESSGNLLAALAANYPEQEAGVLLGRPAVSSRWSVTERRLAGGARGLLFGFVGAEFPEPGQWYEPLVAAFREVYRGLSQPRGEPGVFNAEPPRATGLPTVVVDHCGIAVWWGADAEPGAAPDRCEVRGS